jgi:uncharacterized repeat protein (TIGR03806 family)
MRRVGWSIVVASLIGVVSLVCLTWSPDAAPADEPGAGTKAAAKPAAVRKPYGIETRVPWTTSRVKGSPEPPPPYGIEVAFPKLRFSSPLDLVGGPGLDRLFVAERYGKIYSFPLERDAAEPKLLIDLKKTVYAFAVHPKYPKTPHVYVTYVLDPNEPSAKGTRLSRFTVKADDPYTADPASEQVILQWPSGGHNGGCLKFGPDGYLYIVTGDGSGIADELVIGQDLSSILAKLLRIDVDHPDTDRKPDTNPTRKRGGEAKNYSIPKDNPFMDTKGALPEIWAYGLRQFWRMSFDRATGDLWGGEVGQDLWEMVYRIQRGGNYGWSVQEGSHPFRPERKTGPSPILKPIVEHPHTDFRSITGGFVYHGKRLPELQGTYIYGDFDTGRIWGLRYNRQTQTVARHEELASTRQRIISFGEDKDGELYYLDFVGGQVFRLVRSPAVERAYFPLKLSETGLFASTKDHRPAPGLIPYSVNSELWSDGAVKERFLALPGMSQIEFDTVTYPQPAPGSTPGWRLPDDTVVVKTFSLDLEPGNPASRRRLETRLLHKQQFEGTEEFGDQYWRGYTYIWNDEQTDAELADASGVDRTYTVKDAAAPGGKREQKWHFPSRSECILCHTTPAKYVLGLNTMQMNRDHDYGGVIASQLATFDHLKLFTKPLEKKPAELDRLADYHTQAASLEERARSYLHSNCSHCHRKWGGGNAEFQLLKTLPLAELGIVGTRPGHGAFGLEGGKLLVPGHPEQSLIPHRMRKLGLGRMPHVASNVVDEEAAKLIEEWIRQIK